MEVTGLDPAKASLDVARAKPGAEQVRWIHGDASALPGLHAELATMTGNVAQAVVQPTDWAATLRGVYDALRPAGHLVSESRDPAYRGWREWNRADSYTVTEISGVGAVESWVELTEVALPLVSFRWTYVFGRRAGLDLGYDVALSQACGGRGGADRARVLRRRGPRRTRTVLDESSCSSHDIPADGQRSAGQRSTVKAVIYGTGSRRR
jgi:SAM-dependent methyltransferase